jgi:hypothetical protein
MANLESFFRFWGLEFCKLWIDIFFKIFDFIDECIKKMNIMKE